MLGNGDSTLVITPKGKKILIDGGEPEQNIVVPYLLARKIKTLDYVIVSHFDSDHCGGIKEVLETLTVKKLVISKQVEQTEESRQIIEIAKQKNVEIILVQAKQKLNIEKDIYLNILWPNDEKMIAQNPLNNNSIIAKLIYGNFQMLFTGDIEEIAEKELIKTYGKDLKSTIIKIAHHGSKTSSTSEFIDLVKPQIALIGVRKK